MYNVSEAVSYELRGVYNDDIKRGVQGQSGLSCLSPVINIMRHPLWGRNQVRIFRTMHVLWIKLGGGGRVRASTCRPYAGLRSPCMFLHGFVSSYDKDYSLAYKNRLNNMFNETTVRL